MTTNVKPSDLNYDKYETLKYDEDIINSIPHHQELHSHIISYVEEKFHRDSKIRILELWVWTWLTAKMIYSALPKSTLDLVDFSNQMLVWAKERLWIKNINYIKWDYAELEFSNKYNLVVSVIGIHHQTHEWKKKLFKKIYNLLNKGGVFVFWDLVTYKDRIKSAYNHAIHFHHLVEKTKDIETLWERAHHHMYLNNLAAYEDQIERLEDLWFSVKIEFLKANTCLLLAEK